MPFVVFVNGVTLIFAAALMGLTALIFPQDAYVFGMSAFLTATFGLLITLATAKAPPTTGRVHGFLLTTSVWLTAALAGALPLHLSSLPAVDALFEAMSGITTTGSTVMTGLDGAAHGVLFWRALLQCLGGVGFIVTGIALLPFLRVGGMQLFRTESSDKGDKALSTAAKVASATLLIYFLLIALCCIAYAIGGMSFFDALTHAMTTVSTGGYANYDASFGHFTNPFLHWTATLFMLLGAFPFVWYIRLWTRGFYRSEQVAVMCVSLCAVIVLLAIWLSVAQDIPSLIALRLAAFNVVSVVTTTGYASDDYTLWGSFAVAAFFALTAIGGCTGSTAGGAKFMRWIVLARSAANLARRVRQPHAVLSLRYEGRPLADDVLGGVISFFTFYVGTFALLAFALGLTGLDNWTAISGALTALANVGPGIGEVIGPAGNFASLDNDAKLLLVFGMFAGRLEMLTVYVLFTGAFWREAI
ncbi:TrkH family potassium uptake protein [Pikeienuella piscinae]|uniref:Trk system potassium uptake protein n=1 Tax=Pikeienuella piscinae TaxID=2748098 RepID=A0A7M3T5N9_9RHOB|nr:TrkH family potassium uptake protein [Pikeienuella piscinae]QIE57320.1 TrkH family potassium uptake protein [Pikeienuella piscinae]